MAPAPKRLLPVREQLVAHERAAVWREETPLGRLQDRLVALGPPDLSVFDEDELATMRAVLAEIRDATGTALSELSHEEPGWRLTKLGETIAIQHVARCDGCHGYVVAMANTPITEATLKVNDVEFAYLTAGEVGPLALCLHGYPDSAHTWRPLLAELAAAGYRAVAPFMRGYAPTAVPGDGRYQTGVLALDAIGFHDALGGDEPGVLIGHDWGASAVNGAAVYQPDRWSRVISMAIPPGTALMQALLTNLAQLKRSWYGFFLANPLSDVVIPLNDLAFIDLLWADWSPGFEAGDHVENAKRCLRDPRNLTAALGYYRAVLGGGYIDPALADIQEATAGIPSQPTLCLQGANDGCVGAEVAESARASVTPNVHIEIIPACGHFLHLERPTDVNGRILEFLR